MSKFDPNEVKKSPVKARILILLLVIILFAAGMIYFKFWVQFPKVHLQRQAIPPPTQVAVSMSENDIWNAQINTIGSLVASSGIEVTSELSGIVNGINFQSGQQIERSTVLFSINDEAEIAALASAQANYKSANSQYQRALKLKNKKFVSDNDLDLQRSAVDVAKAQVELAQANLNKKNIKAPFSGRLGIRKVDVGEYVAAGTRLVTLQAIDELFLDFTLPEHHFNELKAGQNVLFQVRSYPGELFIGHILAWDPVLDENTRTVKVRANVNNKDHRLAPGMFAQIKVQSVNRIKVVTVPETAIFYTIYGEAVYVLEKPAGQDLDENFILASRQVKVLYRANGMAGIAQGIEAGVQVVIAGQLKLYPSLKVRVTDDPPDFIEPRMGQPEAKPNSLLID